MSVQNGSKNKVMLVGEQASGKHHNKIDEEFPSPFCSTYGCSGWITKILRDKQH